jgi:hypothetical protein
LPIAAKCWAKFITLPPQPPSPEIITATDFGFAGGTYTCTGPNAANVKWPDCWFAFELLGLTKIAKQSKINMQVIFFMMIVF